MIPVATTSSWFWLKTLKPGFASDELRTIEIVAWRNDKGKLLAWSGLHDYYNTYRTHLGLNKDTPLGRPVQHRGRITSMPKFGGLHHAYVRT